MGANPTTLGTTHYKFDGRGRLVCAGSSVNLCNTLAVTYNGLGERVKEVGSGSKTYLYAGSTFRLSPAAAGGTQEYWIEIEALGERVGYKWGTGGSLRTTGLWPEGISIPPQGREILIGVASMMLLGLLVLVVGVVAEAPSPIRTLLAMAFAGVTVLIPVQVWAGGGSLPPPVAGSAVLRWVMSDRIGSSMVEMDASGSIVSRTTNRPFGGIEEQAGSGPNNTSGTGGRSYYAGHDRQVDSGLVYMNARWMDPGSGTFVSVDPVVRSATTPQTYNGYAYVENNPINATDPSGTEMVQNGWLKISTDPETGERMSTWVAQAPAPGVSGSSQGGGASPAAPSGGQPAPASPPTASPQGGAPANPNPSPSQPSQSGVQNVQSDDSKDVALGLTELAYAATEILDDTPEKIATSAKVVTGVGVAFGVATAVEGASEGDKGKAIVGVLEAGHGLRTLQLARAASATTIPTAVANMVLQGVFTAFDDRIGAGINSILNTVSSNLETLGRLSASEWQGIYGIANRP